MTDKKEIKKLVENLAFAVYEDAQNEEEKDLAFRLLKTTDLPRSEESDDSRAN